MPCLSVCLSGKHISAWSPIADSQFGLRYGLFIEGQKSNDIIFCVSLRGIVRRFHQGNVQVHRPILTNQKKLQNVKLTLSCNKWTSIRINKLCGRPPEYAPPPTSWSFYRESGGWVTCDVAYLYANFSHRSLCSRLRPDVRDRRQTSDRQTQDVRRASSLIMPPTLGAGA